MVERFVVLVSVPPPRPTTNPYVVLLSRSVAAQPGVLVEHFRFKTALLGRYDVFHIHWPETLVAGRSRLKALARQGLVVLLLFRLRVSRTPIVRTVHNLELPQGISRRERFLIKAIDRQTTLRITLNDTTPIAPGQPFELIPHGHYRDWFAEYPEPGTLPGRVTYFGLIRRYKGVDGLVRAFRTISGRDDLTLRVAGKPSTPELENQLRGIADGDPRVSLSFGFLSDRELIDEVGHAELVVLPYREMHNSGGALTTLSLNRPVLLPDNEVNRRLADEVGPGWVFTYSEDVTGQDIVRTIESLRSAPVAAVPNLSARDWPVAGARHVAAYRRAVAIRRARRKRRWCGLAHARR